jgi:hypothetical protein
MSLITAQTRSGGAAMSTLMLKSISRIVRFFSLHMAEI